MSVPKHKYIMDYIPDKRLYAAVMYARNMIREGASPAIAIRKAAFTYKQDISDVAHYVGQVGGRKEKTTK